MVSWIIKLVSFSIFSTVLTLTLPEGKYNNFIKSILCIMGITIFIAPFKNLGFKEFSLDNLEMNNKIQMESVDFSIEKKQKYVEKAIKVALSEQKVEVDEVNVEMILSQDYIYEIRKIDVRIKNSVMLSKDEHIVISEKIKKIIYNVTLIYNKDFEVLINEC